MAKYIDADAFMNKMRRYTPSIYDSMMRQKGFSLEEIEGAVDAEPAADVAEVRHGRWIDKMLDKFRKYECVCSECGARFVGDYDQYCEPFEFDYCPRCGAKMDGEGDDG